MSNVTKTLTVRYRQEGGNELERIAKSIARAQQMVAQASDGAYQAIEMSERRLGGAANAYRNFQNRIEGTAKITRQFHTDMRDLQRAFDAGLIKADEFARGLSQVNKQLQDAGKPTGKNFGMAEDLAKRFNITDDVKKSAKEAAAAFEENFDRLEKIAGEKAAAIARNFGDSFNRNMNIGSSAQQSGASFSALTELNDRLDAIEGNRSARVGQGINERLGINGTTAAQLGATTSALADLSRELDMIEGARAADFGASINKRLNIGGPSAKDLGATTSALVAAEKEAAEYEDRLQRIINEIDPLVAAQKRLNNELETYAALAARGDITTEQLGKANEIAAQRFEYTRRSVDGLGESSKLGIQGMQNIQYQLNDIGVSLASGQSPFTVLMQQGAQMAQEFGPNATVGGALKSIGAGIVSFVTNPLNLAVLAFASVAGAAALIYNAVQSKFPPIQDRIDRQKKAVEDLANAYHLAADGAKSYGESTAGPVLQGRTNRDYRKDFTEFQKRAEGMRKFIQSMADEAVPITDILGNLTGQTEIRFPQISGIMSGFNAKDPESIRDTVNEINRLANASSDQAFKDFALQIADDYEQVGILGERLKGTAALMTDAGRRALYMRENFATAMKGLADMAPAATTEMQRLNAQFKEAMKNANSPSEAGGARDTYKRAVDEMNRASKESLLDVGGQQAEQMMSPGDATIAAIKREYAARIAESVRLKGETQERLNLEREMTIKVEMATEDLRRTEEARLANHQLDIRAIGARGAANLAAIEAERTAITLREQGYKADEVYRRSQEAAALSLAQSAFQQSESARLRLEAQNDNITSMQTELQVMGKSAGETARLTTEYQLLLDAKKAAYAEGRDLGQDEIEQIRKHAAEVGRLTDALAAQRAAQDATFERSQLFRSDADAQAQSNLRGAGIDPKSAFGQQMAAYDVMTQRLSEFRDLNRDIWQGISQDIVDGVKPIEIFGNALKKVGADWMEKSVTKLSDQLFSGAANMLGLDSGITSPMGIGALGSSVANPMWVRSADAGGLLGLGGGGEKGGAGGAIERLLSPGNDNKSGASAYRDAIAAIESRGSGDYGAIGPITKNGDRAYGRYQIMGNNIPSWSKEALGRSISTEEFMSNKGLQDQIFDKKFGGYVSKYGERGAAQAWFGGPGSVGKEGRKDILGTSVGGYGDKFEAELAKLPKSGESAAASASAFAETTTSMTSGIGQTLTAFGQTFSSNTQVMLDGMQGTIGDFLPKFGGNLNSLLSAISSNTGISVGGLAAIFANPTGGLYAGGGYTGPGNRYDVAGTVHRGEYVIPKHTVDQIGVGNLERAYKGYAAGGPVDVSGMVPTRGSGYGDIRVINPPGVPQEVREVKQNPDGSLDIMLDRKIAEAVAKPGKPANRALQAGGLRSPLIPR